MPVAQTKFNRTVAFAILKECTHITRRRKAYIIPAIQAMSPVWVCKACYRNAKVYDLTITGIH